MFNKRNWKKKILPLDDWGCILQLEAMRYGSITISLVAMLPENYGKRNAYV